MSTNPFSLAFGREPMNIIKREKQVAVIDETFNDENPQTYTYIITGVRGSGKTVLLNTVCNRFKEKDDWVVIEINPSRNMLESFAAKLYDKSKLKYKFLKKQFSFSFHGLSISLTGENPVSDVENLLERMLTELEKHGKKVLVAIDEVSNTRFMAEFVQAFQIFNRQNLSLYMLMTGLYENVKSLKNNKTLTFLYRAPTLDLDPLDLSSIKDSYSKLLPISAEKSVELAKLTKGYAFAYQTLGYLYFESKGKDEDSLINEFDRYLREFVYDKIWHSISNNEKKILIALAKLKTGDVYEIYSQIGMKKQTFSGYKDTLIKKGLLVSLGWGFIDFSLPRFAQFIENALLFE